MTIFVNAIDMSSFFGMLFKATTNVTNSEFFVGPVVIWNTKSEKISAPRLLPRPNYLFLEKHEYSEHTFRIPKSQKSQIRQIVSYEIEENTPFNIDELYVWVTLNSVKDQAFYEASALFTPGHLIENSESNIGTRFSHICLVREGGAVKERLPLTRFIGSFKTIGFLSIAILLASLIPTIDHHSKSAYLQQKIEESTTTFEKKRNEYSQIAVQLRELNIQVQHTNRVKDYFVQNRSDPMQTMARLAAARSKGVKYRTINITAEEFQLALESPNILQTMRDISSYFPLREVSLASPISRSPSNSETATIRLVNIRAEQ